MSNFSQTHLNLFEKAKMLAVHGEHRVRVGCIVARKTRPLAGAFNTVRNKDYTSLGDEFHKHTYHAEINCLRLLPYEQVARGGLTLYVCRLNHWDELKASKPCWRCLKHIQEQGAISRIVYWDEDTDSIQMLKV